METLSTRDASALLRFAGELGELEKPLAFPPSALAGLERLIACDTVNYCELDPVGQRFLFEVWQDARGEAGVEAGEASERYATYDWDLFWQLRHTHPVCGYRTASGDWTSPYKDSDFVTLDEFRQTAIYDAFYRGELDHWLDVGLPAEPRRTRLFIFVRLGRDFDERDRLVLKLLQPVLAARAEATELATAGAAALATLEQGANGETSSVVLCSRRGVIEFASPAARTLLERYAGLESGRLPRTLLQQGEFRLVRGDRRLVVRVAPVGGLFVLVLDEQDVRVDRLTARERQVLEHLALGRENHEIALRLGIAPATVAKHLEHVYRKLAVPNRTAAAALFDGRWR